MPPVQQTGVDPVHFGVVFTLNMMIAVITPPIGLCGLIASDTAGIGMRRFAAELRPYLLAMIVFMFTVLSEFGGARLVPCRLGGGYGSPVA